MKRRGMALLLLLMLAVGMGSWARAEASGSEEEEKLIALTFDDGPRAETTGRLLEGLEQRGIRASFFLVGRRIPENEELVLEMAAAGHQVGNHGFDHRKLAGLSEEDFRMQVEETDRMLRRLLGEDEYWLRPPYGLIDGEQRAWVQVPVVRWSVDPEDWAGGDPGEIARRIVKNAEDGDIVLLHDFFSGSVDAALQAADLLRERGFTLVTVEELLERKGLEAEAGRVYNGAFSGEYS